MVNRRLILQAMAASTLASAVPIARASSENTPQLGDDGLYTQPWFMQTFLDLRDDLNEAKAAGKRFAIIWEQKGCPYCKELHTVNLTKPVVHDYISEHFGVLQLNLWGAREVTDFNGEVMSERDLARAWRVNFTPTIQFFDKDLTGKDGKSGLDLEVARMPGYFKPFHFMSMFEFVETQAYDRLNFQRFLQNKFAELKAKGIDPNVW